MQQLKVILTLKMKGDPDDTDLLEAEIRDELRALADEENELVYRVIAEEIEEEEDEDF